MRYLTDSLLVLPALLALVSGCVETDIYTMYRRDDCDLTKVPTDIPEESETVSLPKNLITRLHVEEFSDLSKCRGLILDENLIFDIEPEAFEGLDRLEELSLMGNQLTFIYGEMMWKGIRNLEQLDLSYNQIIDIEPEAFKYLPNLQRLNLMSNNLTEVYQDMWYGLFELKQLWLNFNQITTVWHEGFANLPLLERLVLSENSLTTLEANVFSPIDTPGLGHPTNLVLLIYDNPMVCDSRMCWMKKAEKEGWISYNALYDAPPECANTDNGWYYIDLNCTSSENEV